ncbi:MAG: hypothetical protein Q7R83_03010 [bacterium]|nr:hypothetical protein [bacterium]
MDEEELRPGVREWWRSLAREQRTAALVLGTVSVVVVGLAYGYWQTKIIAPFRVSKSTVVQANKIFDAIAEQSEDKIIEKEKTQDTDHDGLSDYDEQYLYQTSRYLPDTDSDGIPDMIEVVQGSNPSCPQGQSCVPGYEDIALRPTSTNSDLLQTPAIPLGPAGSVTSSEQVQKIQEFLDAPADPRTMTPARIKDYLVSHNLVTLDQLAPLTDAQLTELYQVAYEEALRIKQAQNGGNPGEYNPYGSEYNQDQP